jgi:hypothetical protein
MRLADVPDHLYERPFGLNEAYEGLSPDFLNLEEEVEAGIPPSEFESFHAASFEDDLDFLEMEHSKGGRIAMPPVAEFGMKGLENGLLGDVSLRKLLFMADNSSSLSKEVLRVLPPELREIFRPSTIEELEEMWRILMFFMEKWHSRIADALAKPDPKVKGSANTVYTPTGLGQAKLYNAKTRDNEKTAFKKPSRWNGVQGHPDITMKFGRAPMLMPFEIVSVPDHPNLAQETYYPVEGLEIGSGYPSEPVEGMEWEPVRRLFVCLAKEQAEASNLAAVMQTRGAEEFPIEGRMEAVIDAMRGCAILHDKGKVHRDVKPGNIFCNKNHDLDCLNWALGDHEVMIDSGHPISTAIREIEKQLQAVFLFHGTPGYLDSSCYQGLKNQFYTYTPATDVFAFGVTLLAVFYKTVGEDLQEKLKTFFKKIDFDNEAEEIAELLRELFLEFEPKFPVPDNVRFQLAKMLMFEPEERCGLKEVIETLEDEYQIV